MEESDIYQSFDKLCEEEEIVDSFEAGFMSGYMQDN
jgi:hypothetical protein